MSLNLTSVTTQQLFDMQYLCFGTLRLQKTGDNEMFRRGTKRRGKKRGGELKRWECFPPLVSVSCFSALERQKGRGRDKRGGACCDSSSSSSVQGRHMRIFTFHMEKLFPHVEEISSHPCASKHASLHHSRSLSARTRLLCCYNELRGSPFGHWWKQDPPSHSTMLK